MPDLDLTLDRARLDALRHGAVVVETRPAVFRVTGSGALTCLQGLLTSDLLAPGDGALLYGAMLTPKGAIVTDAWVFRRGEVVTLVVPCEGRAAALEIPAVGEDEPALPGQSVQPVVPQPAAQAVEHVRPRDRPCRRADPQDDGGERALARPETRQR